MSLLQCSSWPKLSLHYTEINNIIPLCIPLCIPAIKVGIPDLCYAGDTIHFWQNLKVNNTPGIAETVRCSGKVEIEG